MTEHLSAQLIEQYRARRIAPVELLALDEHLSQCDACRLQLRGALGMLSPMQVAEQLFTKAGAAAEHPAGEVLRRFHHLDEVDRELITAHLEDCAACRAQVQSLSAQPVPIAHPSPHWLAQLFPFFFGEAALTWRLASAVALLALLIWGITRWSTTRVAPSEVVMTQTPVPTRESELTSPTTAPRVYAPLGTPTPEVKQKSLPPSSIRPLTKPTQAWPESLLALKEGGSANTLAGLESLAVSDKASLRQALRSGRLETPQWLPELNTGASVLMGNSNEQRPSKSNNREVPSVKAEWGTKENYALKSPVGEVVAEAVPTFTWRALEGATHYVVTISDPAENYREVVVSPPLAAMQWQPATALPAGRRLVWQVAAQTSDGERLAPVAPAPEARFLILTDNQRQQLEQGRLTYAGRHLPLALLYARLGLIAPAEVELQHLAADNPEAALVREWLRNLRAARR